MATLLTVRCPDCAHKFSIRMQDDGKLPTFCPACGNRMEGDDPDFVPKAAHIGTLLGKSGDQTYRMLEESSERRAEMAGDPSLKITNLKDNLREGDVAAIAPNNPVTQYADALRGVNGFNYFQGSVGGELAGVKTGAERGTGSPVLEAIQGGASSPIPAVRGMRGKWGNA